MTHAQANAALAMLAGIFLVVLGISARMDRESDALQLMGAILGLLGTVSFVFAFGYMGVFG